MNKHIDHAQSSQIQKPHATFLSVKQRNATNGGFKPATN